MMMMMIRPPSYQSNHKIEPHVAGSIRRALSAPAALSNHSRGLMVHSWEWRRSMNTPRCTSCRSIQTCLSRPSSTQWPTRSWREDPKSRKHGEEAWRKPDLPSLKPSMSRGSRSTSNQFDAVCTWLRSKCYSPLCIIIVGAFSGSSGPTRFGICIERQ